MWKAILVLILTTSTHPMATMVGEFPDTFTSKTDCQAFIAVKRGHIGGSVEIITGQTSNDAKIIHHELGCVEDTGGLGA